MVRVWKTAASSGPVTLYAPGFRRARAADLLEREGGELAYGDGQASCAVSALGFAGVLLDR